MSEYRARRVILYTYCTGTNVFTYLLLLRLRVRVRVRVRVSVFTYLHLLRAVRAFRLLAASHGPGLGHRRRRPRGPLADVAQLAHG